MVLVAFGCGPDLDEVDDCPLDLGESADVRVAFGSTGFRGRYAWFSRRVVQGESVGLGIKIVPSVEELVRTLEWEFGEDGSVTVNLDTSSLETGRPISPSSMWFAPGGFGFGVAGTVTLDRIDPAPPDADATGPPVVAGSVVADAMGEELSGSFTAYYCAALEDPPP